MKARINHGHNTWEVDYDRPVDLSIPLCSEGGVQAWGVGPARIEPYRFGGQTFSVEAGSPVNFCELQFGPHAHVTHTETSGHIREKGETVNRVLPFFRGPARLISIEPEVHNGMASIGADQVMEKLQTEVTGALVIRTLPNSPDKKSAQYTGRNPAFLEPEAMQYILNSGVEHLLVDLPSVDPERDGGAVRAHRIFWGADDFPEARSGATITELIYVPGDIQDGDYWLELHVAPVESDASPSRPLLFPLKKIL